jgi:hypothetical protein
MVSLVITFKTFLESESAIQDRAFEIASKIGRDCEYFFEQADWDPSNVRNTSLFRGMRKINDDFSLQKTLKSRWTTDSSQELTDILDDYLFKKSKIHFRKDSFFCCGDNSVANDYGTVFYIFPIGKFEYAWSPVVDDAYKFFEAGPDEKLIQKGAGTSISGTPGSTSFDLAEWYDTVEKFLNKTDPYKFNDLRDAIRLHKANEIMIHCDQYYAIKARSDLSAAVFKLMSGEL